MKTLDPFSKKFLSVCLGASIVLLSAGFLVNSVAPAKAESKNLINEKISTGSGVEIYPLGNTGGNAYWLEFSDNSGWKFRAESLTIFK